MRSAIALRRAGQVTRGRWQATSQQAMTLSNRVCPRPRARVCTSLA
jgi:hypothetical protein